MSDEAPHQSTSVIERERPSGPKGIAFECSVELLPFPVQLGVAGRITDMAEPDFVDKGLEIKNDGLETSADDHPRRMDCIFTSLLNAGLDVRLKAFPELPVEDGLAIAIENGAEVVKVPAEA